jgi:hypothetical protein
MFHNTLRQSWELRFKNYLSGSYNLTAGLDVTYGTDIHVEVQKYPNGHIWAAKQIYVYGYDMHDIQYSDVTDTIKLNFRPVDFAISASYGGGFTSSAGIDFHYYGPAGSFNYAPAMFEGKVIWDDVSAPQDRSTMYLLGSAIRVNGANGQMTPFRALIGTRYATFHKYDLNQAKVFVDGSVPLSNFGYQPPAVPPFSVDMGVPSEVFRVVSFSNANYSAHDLQVGVFLNVTNVAREAGGVRLKWNSQSTNLYTLHAYPFLGGPTNILGTNLSGEFLDPQALTNSMRYYRLRAQ